MNDSKAMKRNEPEAKGIEGASTFRIKTPNPFHCARCGNHNGGVMLWAEICARREYARILGNINRYS